MRPYYEDTKAGIVIYHGDCREVLPGLEKVDLVLTDPPYGIQADERQSKRANKQHGAACDPSRDYGESCWDREAPQVIVSSLPERAAKCIIWGGNFFSLPPSKAWLVWDKLNGNNGYADAELAWTNLNQAVRIKKHRWMGMLKEPSDDGDIRVHPTQKPVELMSWCLSFISETHHTVVDPFMGSGTTLRAAKDLGRRAIGIEIEERYWRDRREPPEPRSPAILIQGLIWSATGFNFDKRICVVSDDPPDRPLT